MQFNSAALNDNSLVNEAKNSNISIFGNIYINTSTTPNSDNFSKVNNFINLVGSIIQTNHPLILKDYLKTIIKNNLHFNVFSLIVYKIL